jgi:hypothetical protein
MNFVEQFCWIGKDSVLMKKVTLSYYMLLKDNIFCLEEHIEKTFGLPDPGFENGFEFYIPFSSLTRTVVTKFCLFFLETIAVM